MKPNLKPEMQSLIERIGTKNMYSGNRIPESIMKTFEIVEDDFHIGILVPYWLSVLQEGRGPRRSNKDSGLWKKIYRWMEKHNMFRSGTNEGKIREAKFITLYINRHGNQQFRSKTFIDIYKTERERTIQEIDKKFSTEINKITMQVL